MREGGSLETLCSLGLACKITGLTERQIRYYETAGLIRPRRSKGNHRLYSPAELQLLARIRGLREKGYNLKDIRNMLHDSRANLEDLLAEDVAGRWEEYGDAGIHFARFRGKVPYSVLLED